MTTTYTYTITAWADDGTLVNQIQLPLDQMMYTSFPVHANPPSNPFPGMAYIQESDGKLQIYTQATGWRGVAWELL